MKKILSVLLAVLVVFSTFSVAVFAEDTTEAPAVEETTKESIKNDEGLVYPQSKNQLEFAVIFKVFEKIINYFIDLINEIFPDLNLDNVLAGGVGDLAGKVESSIPQA